MSWQNTIFFWGFIFGQNLNKFDPPKKILLTLLPKWSHRNLRNKMRHNMKFELIVGVQFFKGGLHTSRCDDGVTASWKTRSFTIFYCKSVTASAFFSIYLLYATLQSFFLFLFHLCSLQSIFFSFFNAKICRKLNSIERGVPGYHVQITGFFHKANTIWSFEVCKFLKVNSFFISNLLS